MILWKERTQLFSINMNLMYIWQLVQMMLGALLKTNGGIVLTGIVVVWKLVSPMERCDVLVAIVWMFFSINISAIIRNNAADMIAK